MRTKYFIITVIITIAMSNIIFGQNSTPTKNEKILQLLDLSGSSKIGDQFSTYFINSLKTTQLDIDQSFLAEFANEFNGNELIKLIIPIYDKHYTEEEIDQLILFYQSPVGKMVVEKMPLVMQESMQIGQTWGMEIGKKIMDKLEKRRKEKK